VADDRSVVRLGTAPATTGWHEHRRKARVWHEVAFDDWVIDGTPLRQRVSARSGDVEPAQQLTCLDPAAPSIAVAGLRALLGESAPDFDDGRVALLTCPIDRDLDCTALSTRVVVHADIVEWSDVGWQVTYEPFVPEPDEDGALLSFRFDRLQYETLLRRLLTHYEARAALLPPREPVDQRRRRWFRRAAGSRPSDPSPRRLARRRR
jgi:hypothetical protein